MRSLVPNLLRRIAVVAAGLLTVPAAAAPYVPAADSEILETVAVPSGSAGQDLRRQELALEADRQNRPLAVHVAQLDMARGRLLADPRYFGRAEAALAPWLMQPDPPDDVRLLRGTLRQFFHDFDAALDDLDHVLGRDPRNGQARLTRAVVRMVRADYDGAGDDCAQLLGAAPGAAMDACVAAVAGLTGHARPAAFMLARAAGQAETPDIRVWALTLEGEAFQRLGQMPQALASFAQARSVAPDDAYLLAASADALIDAGRPAEALRLLDGHTRADALLLRVTEAEQLSGTPDPAKVAQLRDRFETSRRRGESIHQREEARFALHVLHEPQAALRLAEADWQVQREPADARIVLEAAVAASQPGAAAAVLAWRRASGIEDAALDRLAAQVGAAQVGAAQVGAAP